MNTPYGILTYVVDDDRQILDLFRAALGHHWDLDEMCIEYFSDPLTVRNRIKVSPCDILITDLEMPNLSGIDLLEFCRRSSPWAQMLVVSSHSSFEFVHAAVSTGASDYLIKPLSTKQIRSQVERAAKRVIRWRTVLSTAVAKVWE